MKLVARVSLVIILLTFFLSGCGEEPVATAPPASAKKVNQVKPVAPAPVEQKEEPKAEFKYSPIGKRDPFESLLRQEKESKDISIPKTPLEKFELGQFRVQAILIGKGAPRAMVSAPDGKNYILKPGLRIGRNNGVVKSITETAILVEESSLDYLGNVIKSLQSITIPEQKSF